MQLLITEIGFDDKNIFFLIVHGYKKNTRLIE